MDSKQNAWILRGEFNFLIFIFNEFLLETD